MRIAAIARQPDRPAFFEVSQLVTALLLLIPGILSAVGYTWLGSGRAWGIPRTDSTAFLLLLPWQLLGLTIAKFGVDAWALARAAQSEGFHLRLGEFTLGRILPAGILYGGLLLLRLPFLACIAITISVVADAVALVCAGELSGKGRVRGVAIAHLLRFPLFFALVFCVAASNGMTLPGLLLLMCVSSGIRMFALIAMRSSRGSASRESPHTRRLAMQQILNYGLFKNDQLLFSLFSSTATELERAAFVFFARFPELISAAVGALGTLLYPLLVNRPNFDPTLFSSRSASARWLLMLIVICPCAYFYSTFSPHLASVRFSMLLAVACHGSFILSSNLVTYRLLRTNDLKGLNRAGAIANVTGLSIALLVIALTNSSLENLLWVISVQQLIFLFVTRISADSQRSLGRVAIP